jgi:tetratricopeptide (TPR) repeat protein
MRLGHYEEAANALEKATSTWDPTAYMWNNLGMAYEHLDKLELARAAYRQASDLGSNSAEESLVRLEGVDSIAELADPEAEEAADEVSNDEVAPEPVE